MIERLQTMPTLTFRSSAVPFLLLAGLLVLSGCRTYGGYDTEELTMQQIGEANEAFAADLERARAEQQRVASAASTNPVLTSIATEHAEVVALHEAKLEEHLAFASELAEGASYRALNRGYGAIISDQAIVHDLYEGLFNDALLAVQLSPVTEPPLESRWYVVPPQYDLMRRQMEERSISGLLN